jgi:DNA-binding response OmpR family regulator
MQAGATRYLTKPFTPGKLLQEVRDVLGRAVGGTR